MEPVIRTARTVEEAEELALKELGIDRNEAEVEILSRGKAGFLGIGAEMARVRVTQRSVSGATHVSSSSPGDTSAAVGRSPISNVNTATEGTAASIAIDAVNRVLSLAKVNVVSTLRSENDPEVGGPIIDLTGEDSGLLIGRRGQTLQALQFVVNMIARKELGESIRVVLDVEHYRQRREDSLRDMSTKVASRVAQTGRSITLEPMSAADRRMVHVSLADYQGVRTESVGMGEDRKVTIFPTSRTND